MKAGSGGGALEEVVEEVGGTVGTALGEMTPKSSRPDDE
jgi:hypothetical protein